MFHGVLFCYGQAGYEVFSGLFFCIYKESMEYSVGYFFAVFPEVEGGYRMLFSVTRGGRVWGVGYGARVSDRTQHIQR